jgi:addiction module HigA family antidote
MMNKLITNQYEPTAVSPPGETLRDVLEERSISQRELATRMGRPEKTISEIVNGKASITADTALQLELVLDIPAAFWNAREQHYREFLAREAQEAELANRIEWARRFPYAAMVKQGLISAARRHADRVRELLRFFGVSSPEQWEETYASAEVAFRRSASFEFSREALSVWLRAGVLQAQAIPCAPYNRTRFVEALTEVRAITGEPPEVFQSLVVEFCADAGVAVAFVPQLPRSRVSGATRWLSPEKALVQLSLRYKSDDHLWFTFFHEAAHVLLHGKKLIFLEGSGHEGHQEGEANRWAGDFLIPPPVYDELVSASQYTRALLQAFARRLGIAPGIVVGRLQHDGRLPHSHCNDLKRRLRWAD